MARVKRGTVRRRKRKKLLARAKGYYANKSKLYRAAKESVDTALKYAFVGRRRKKRDFRRLWVVRINAAARQHGLNYGQFMAASSPPASRSIARCWPTSLFASRPLSPKSPPTSRAPAQTGGPDVTPPTRRPPSQAAARRGRETPLLDDGRPVDSIAFARRSSPISRRPEPSAICRPFATAIVGRRSGAVTALLKSVATASPADRPALGRLVNELKALRRDRARGPARPPSKKRVRPPTAWISRCRAAPSRWDTAIRSR